MRNQRNIALVKTKPGTRVLADQRDHAQQSNRQRRDSRGQAREHNLHAHQLARPVHVESTQRGEGSYRARRVRPYHGRVGVFIYYRQIVRAYDPVTTVCVAFLLGMLIAFCWCYSCQMDEIIAFGQTHLGW